MNCTLQPSYPSAVSLMRCSLKISRMMIFWLAVRTGVCCDTYKSNHVTLTARARSSYMRATKPGRMSQIISLWFLYGWAPLVRMKARNIGLRIKRMWGALASAILHPVQAIRNDALRTKIWTRVGKVIGPC